MKQKIYKSNNLLRIFILILGTTVLESDALAAAECFPAGFTNPMQELGFFDRAILEPGGQFVIVQDKASKKANVYLLPEGKKLSGTKHIRTTLKLLNEKEVAFETGGIWTAIDVLSEKKRNLTPKEAVGLRKKSNNDATNGLPIRSSLPISEGYHISTHSIYGGNSLIEIALDRKICTESIAAPLSQGKTVETLQKFSRPSGFSGPADLAQWLEIARSGRAPPGLLAASLLGILDYSPELFEALSAAPAGVVDYSNLDQKLLTKSEKLTISIKVEAYLLRSFKLLPDTHFDTLKHVAPLIRSMASDDAKAKLLAILSDRAVEDAASMPDLKDMPPYQIYAFAYNTAAKLFNYDDSVKFTDLVAAQSLGKVRLWLLGTEPLEDAGRNSFGFFSKPLQTINSNELVQPLNLEWKWLQGTQHYQALISIQAHSQQSVGKPPNSFPGKARRGLVVMGSNLEVELTKATIAEYVHYFEKSGFKFAEPEAVQDLYGLLAVALSSRGPALDYFIKEAHTNGNSDIVFKMPAKGWVLRGTKSRSANGKEAFDILYSLKEDPTERLVSNADFSALLNHRYAPFIRPLIYLNSSCWSYIKASVELGWMNASEIMEVSSLGPVNYMEANDNSAEKVLLDGIRSGAEFKKIRKRLKQQADYAGGHSDTFVFPDEPAYARKIIKYGVRPPQISRQFFTWVENGDKATYLPDGY